jgi:hypothetical protein
MKEGLTGSRSPLPFMDREPDELCENLEAWSSMLVMVLMNHEHFKSEQLRAICS